MTRRTNVLLIGLIGAAILALIAAGSTMWLASPAVAQPDQTPGIPTTPTAAATPVPPAETLPTAETGITRTIMVIGRGEAAGQPDTATVQIGAETRAPTAQEALSQNNSQVQAIRDQLTDLGIAENDIQTSSFSILPDYADRDQQEISGYVVRNILGVTIRDITQAGELLDQVVDVGANRVYGITFRIDDQQELMGQARLNAIQDAQQRASQYASAVGATLGEIVAISEDLTMPGPMPVARDVAQEAAVPIAPGEQQLSASVRVTFALQ